MKKYISFGNFEKKYFFYILGYFAIDLGEILFFFLLNLKNINGRYESLMTEFAYIGIIKLLFKNFGLSLYFIPELILKKCIFPQSSQSSNSNKLDSKMSKKKIIIHFIIFFFILIINMYCDVKSYEYYYDYEINYIQTCFFEVLTLFIIPIIFFKEIYYKHQYFSIILILFISCIEYILDSYYLVSEKWKYSVLFFELIYNVSNSISFGFTKLFIEKYYFSPYKICFLIGFIKLVLFLLICLIYNRFDLLYSIIFSQELPFLSYFYFIFFIFISPISLLLINMIIEKYTICHIFLINQIYCFSNSLLFCIYRQNKAKKNSITIIMIIVGKIITFIFEMFLTLVFLELVELKCFGLNKNLKKYIEKRAIEDTDDLDINDEKNDNPKFELDDNYVAYLHNEETLEEEDNKQISNGFNIN